MQTITIVLSVILAFVIVDFITELRAGKKTEGEKQTEPVVSFLRRAGVRPWHLFLVAAMAAVAAIVLSVHQKPSEAPGGGAQPQVSDTLSTVGFRGKPYFVIYEGDKDGHLVMVPMEEGE